MEEKKYDLEERTLLFAIAVRNLVKILPRTISNIEDMKQIVRSSASVGANYIEANEALSKRDFVHRIKICKKEAKETIFWLRLLRPQNESSFFGQIDDLLQEAKELLLILGSIYQKASQSLEFRD
ncbi:four helix bundle protein [Candidatus Uhrbacteria bacterium RIFOXYB2_FULL_45_11]|uniref:Four helix bundle protein n=1 Tax=Candidatus Uhrbacteria bacterium RIFOXYB2_FULL_45_11 TaxID=1802421 RepID=A0A1F7W7K0_9BACT|nr:MAG: four helix bundle protein [Candidatus Uhrbacteria bacterium RIFOXYB2_FULL_45_11]